MNEDSTFPALSSLLFRCDLLEVDEKLLGVMLGVGQELSGVESENVVRDDLW